MASIFKILKNYTFDEKVLTLLSNFDKGQFGEFTFEKCVLSCGNKSVNLTGVSSNKTLEENAEIFILFYEFIKIFLKKDFVEKKVENVEWKKQKKENKEKLIHTYVLHLKEKYNLSHSEQTKTENFININLKLNYITSNDITIINDEIVEIKNISFDTSKRAWNCAYQFHDNFDIPAQEPDETSRIYGKIDKYFEKK